MIVHRLAIRTMHDHNHDKRNMNNNDTNRVSHDNNKQSYHNIQMVVLVGIIRRNRKNNTRTKTHGDIIQIK